MSSSHTLCVIGDLVYIIFLCTSSRVKRYGKGCDMRLVCAQFLEMDLDGSEVKEMLISEGVSELVANLEACSKLCAACSYSRSPFFTVPSQF